MLLPSTICPCKTTPPFPVPRLPNLDELQFTKKTTTRNRSPFTWNTSCTQRHRDRQMDITETVSPGSQFCSANAHQASYTAWWASVLCWTNIESRKWNNPFSRRDSAQLPEREEQELNQPNCFTHTWSLKESIAKTSSFTHTHPHSLSHHARREKN